MTKKHLPNDQKYVWNSMAYKAKYADLFRELPDQALVEAFNTKVGIRYFNFAIQGFMNALDAEIRTRGFDLSAITTNEALSWKYKIGLNHKKIYPLIEPMNDVLKNEHDAG